MTETKRLYKSNDKILSGVLAGVAEYFNIDPTLVRLGYVVFTIATGVFPAILGYIIAAIIIPQKPHIHHHAEYTEVKHEPKHEEHKQETPPQNNN